MNKKIKKSTLPGKAAMTLLRLGLPIISGALICFSVKLYSVAKLHPLTALSTYPDMLGQIMASLLLLVFAALIFDIFEMP